MPISFNNIPEQWRIPLYWVEVDPSQAGLPIIRQPALIVGTMMQNVGVAVPNIPKPIGTQAQADREYGQGSELSMMMKAFFANNFAHEVWALPLLPDTGSTAASGTITISSTSSPPAYEAGVIALYVAGHKVAVTIGASDTPTEIATQIALEINAEQWFPVTATSAGAVVTVTCKTPGINGNDIQMRLNYFGRIGGEETPIGLVVIFSGSGESPPSQIFGWLTGGAGIPDYDDAIAQLGEREFEYVALAHTDSTTLLAWETEYGFSDTGRWGWMRQLYGHLFAARRAEYADHIIWGMTRNSGLTSVLGIERMAPSPIYEWAAAYAAKAARALTNDPARPLQTLGLNSIIPAKGEDRFNLMELNSMSGTGIATHKVGADGVPIILRETTTYQLNLYSQSDDAYELVTTLATLAKLIRNQRHAITSKFPRHKLANDGTRFGVGQAIVTPKSIKAELVAQYRIDEFNGLVEDVTNFKRHLIVERHPNNPNRVNVLYPPDLVNQLRIFAVLAQFRLQYNRGQDAEITAGITGARAAA
jgi:phage tail sheath gpL-like